MSSLAYTRLGQGAPLVLLHGIGLSRQSWDPVVPALARQFDVIAVDLPGFGDSPQNHATPADADAQAEPAALARAVAVLLAELGVTEPHVAGNSLGGWVALELAAIHPVASLTLLSPAGLWRRNTPAYCRVSLRASRWLARHVPGPLSRLVNYRLGRVLVLGQTHGHPTRLTPGYARSAIAAMGTCPGFDATLAATATRRCLAATAIDVPVTVAFGSRDVLLPRRLARHLDQLPPAAQEETLPGCGHVPMADDPAAVTALISRTAARAGTAGARAGARAGAAGTDRTGDDQPGGGERETAMRTPALLCCFATSKDPGSDNVTVSRVAVIRQAYAGDPARSRSARYSGRSGQRGEAPETPARTVGTGSKTGTERTGEEPGRP